MGRDTLDLLNSIIFLGLNIDAFLQWAPEIVALAGRLNSATYAVRMIRICLLMKLQLQTKLAIEATVPKPINIKIIVVSYNINYIT